MGWTCLQLKCERRDCGGYNEFSDHRYIYNNVYHPRPLSGSCCKDRHWWRQHKITHPGFASAAPPGCVSGMCRMKKLFLLFLLRSYTYVRPHSPIFVNAGVAYLWVIFVLWWRSVAVATWLKNKAKSAREMRCKGNFMHRHTINCSQIRLYDFNHL